MRRLLGAIGMAVLLTAVGTANAQTQMVERSVKTAPNKDTQIGVYLNVLPDCTSGPLPTIRLAAPPASGKVIVKTAKVKATNYKACLALEVPAYVLQGTAGIRRRRRVDDRGEIPRGENGDPEDHRQCDCAGKSAKNIDIMKTCAVLKAKRPKMGPKSDYLTCIFGDPAIGPCGHCAGRLFRGTCGSGATLLVTLLL